MLFRTALGLIPLSSAYSLTGMELGWRSRLSDIKESSFEVDREGKGQHGVVVTKLEDYW